MARGITIVSLFVLAAVAAVAAAAGHGDPSPPRTVATVTSGSFEIENSRSGTPIFSASDIGPGDGANGTVTIANDGDEAAELKLRQHDVADTPGAGGGLLSAGMSMRIREVGDPAKPRSIYEGALAPMPALDLGPIGPEQSRVFEFDASLPDSGTPAGATAGDNAFQGAALSVGYSWTAGQLPPAAAATPGSPSPSAGSAGAPAARAVQLTILRVRAAIRHHRLVLWAYCGPGTCQVLARLRFKAHRSGRARARALGTLRRQRSIAGSQRLVFKLSPGLQRVLRAAVSKGEKATASVLLVLRNRGVEPISAHGGVRLRHLDPDARHGRR